MAREMDQEVQHIFISRTEGEALEVIRGTEREPCLEQWRRPAALHHPLAAGRGWDDSRQPLIHHPSLGRHREGIGDQRPRDMRLAILLSLCPTDLEKELTAQEHLFSDHAQMRALIVTVINSRSNDDGNFERRGQQSRCRWGSEAGELYRLGVRNGKKVFTKPLYDARDYHRDCGKRRPLE